MSRMSPDLNMGMTLAIFNLLGTMPVDSESENICCRGVIIKLETFFIMFVEIPLISGVFLSLSCLSDCEISSNVTGWFAISNDG